jgi:DNA polymerase III subunit alpha
LSWIPLHVHSQYSILDSTASVSLLVKKAKSYQMQSIALTDQGNMYGVVEFYKKCVQEKIKPIIGCELWLALSSRHEKKKIPNVPVAFPVVLLAKDKLGYKNLCKLASIGYLEGFYYYPRIDKEVLERYSKGLICLSGSINSLISYTALNKENDLNIELEWFVRVFKDDFFLELQRHQMSEIDIKAQNMEQESWLVQKLKNYEIRQQKVNSTLIKASEQYNIKCVATNDIHYLEKNDWRAHEILLNVQSGEPCEIWERDSFGNPKNRIPNPKRKTYPSHEHYFKSSEIMENIFKDIPQAIQNSKIISDRCNCELDFETKHYPIFVPPDLQDKTFSKEQREQSAGKFLYDLCLEGINKRYTTSALEKVREKYPSEDPMQVVKNRLDQEFEIISSKGMCDYLLIVHDFIFWAKKKYIPVGPGRGSAAGSIIAYLIGITDIEPLRFDLFFERFINPERISYPDIDVDICMERRSEVIDYTIDKYGKDRVAQIITFGKMKAKMAIKDVGRVLSVPLSKVNLIAKLIPDDLNITIEKALQVDPDLKQLYESDNEAKMILDEAKKVEGGIRNTSIHAAGIIVSEVSISENIPVCTAKDTDIVVTQYSMKPVEAVGMLKIDFLGLKTLTSIQKAVELVSINHHQKLNWSDLPLDNKKTFNLLNQGKTLGIFQLESGGMQELAKQLHIDCFEEIIAVGALYRPGPMDMIPSFINRKHGKEEIELDHPWMKDILAETYGVMVYQEQIMQIASKLAGYSLGEGDVLRKAMGKKDKDEMVRQKEKFVNGAKSKGLNEETAEKIFSKIEKFASYGFNKSHATAYAYLSYTTAYLKANYPKEWMAALMTCDRDDLSKVAKFIRECQAMNIAILPPDINEASSEFVPTKDGIRFAMLGIKGVGAAAVDEIVKERKASGPFADLYDFTKRVNTTKVGKKNIELLVDAGGFDFTGWSRDELRSSVEGIYNIASKEQKEKSQGIMNFFSLIQETKKPNLVPPKITNPSSKQMLLYREKELLGFYLTGHPMESFQEIIKKLNCTSFKDVHKLKTGEVFKAAFIVESVQYKITNKSQKKFAIITISDGMERFEIPIWPDLYEEKQHFLVDNMLLLAILQSDKSSDIIRLNCKHFEGLEDFQEKDLESFNQIFEKFKSQKKSKTMTKSSKQIKPSDMLILHLNLKKIQMSNILVLKDLFRQNAGNSKIELHFHMNKNFIGRLSIESTWGVKLQSSFMKSLETMVCISHIEILKS